MTVETNIPACLR